MKAKDYCEVNWKDIVQYDESSPSCLRWKVDLHREDGKRFRKAGDIVGSFSSLKYWKVIHNGNTYVCHRIVYILFNIKIEQTDKIDHIDGNGGNNVISNLRLVTQKINTQNKKKRSDNTSNFTGVMLITRKRNNVSKYWEAQWIDCKTNKLKSKSFSVNKYGYKEAFCLALNYRKIMLQEQNSSGACYTERHGM